MFGTIDRFGYWFDEIQTVRSVALTLPEMWRERIANGHPPLFFLVEWVLARLAGTEPASLRTPAALCVLATAPVVYAIARRLSRPWIGFASALLFLAMPVEIGLAHLARANAASALISVLATWVLVSTSPERARRDAIAFGILGAVNLYTNASSILVLASQSMLLLCAIRRHRPLALGAAAAWLAAVPLFLAFRAFSNLQERLDWTSGYTSVSATSFFVQPFVLDAGGMWFEPWRLDLLALGAAVLAAGVAGAGVAGWRSAPVVAIWLGPPLIARLAALAGSPDVTSVDRYFGATWAGGCILLGVAMGHRRRAVALAARVVFVAVLALSAYGSDLYRRSGRFPPIAEAAAMVGANRGATEAVVLHTPMAAYWATFLFHHGGEVYDLAAPTAPPRDEATLREREILKEQFQAHFQDFRERAAGRAPPALRLPAETTGVWIYLLEPLDGSARGVWEDLVARFPDENVTPIGSGRLVHRWRVPER